LATPQNTKRSRARIWLGRLGKTFLALLTVAITVGLLAGWRGFGHRPSGARKARMEQSPVWRDGQFRNPQPLVNLVWPAIVGAFHASSDRTPSTPVSTEMIEPARFATNPPTGLRVTWLGHSTTYIELDGQRILTDPMFSERSSPIGWIGPRRFFPPLIALDALPRPTAVLISHDHFDHLDDRTITAMKDWDVVFIVPLGVGAHLAYWGVPAAHIVELDWWQHTQLGTIDIACTPARHASGRMLIDNDRTLWASYALLGPKHRVFYSGDTGLFPGMADIGTRFGPFDLTLIEIGQYHAAWPDWHIGPEQAVQAHQLLRGKALFPIHWGLLGLAYHGWTEPIERVIVAGKAAGSTVFTPRPGQSVEPDAPPTFDRWWPELPWHNGVDDPILSTQLNSH